MEALRAKAARSPASRAATGLVQPCSSVDIKAVAPAPVTASGPVQIRCCVEGVRGWRLKDKSTHAGATLVRGPLKAPARFSIVGSAMGDTAPNKSRALRDCALASVLGKKLQVTHDSSLTFEKAAKGAK